MGAALHLFRELLGLPQGLQNQQDLRMELRSRAQVTHTVSQIVMGGSAVVLIAAAVNIVTFPIFGMIFVLLGSSLLLTSHEVFKVSKNVDDAFDATLPSTRRLAQKIYDGTMDPQQWCEVLFKDTLILRLRPVRSAFFGLYGHNDFLNLINRVF
jgi:hypothetical protein